MPSRVRVFLLYAAHMFRLIRSSSSCHVRPHTFISFRVIRRVKDRTLFIQLQYWYHSADTRVRHGDKRGGEVVPFFLFVPPPDGYTKISLMSPLTEHKHRITPTKNKTPGKRQNSRTSDRTTAHAPLHVHPVAKQVDEHQQQKQKGGRPSTVEPRQHHQQSRCGAAVRHHVQHGAELGSCRERKGADRREVWGGVDQRQRGGRGKERVERHGKHVHTYNADVHPHEQQGWAPRARRRCSSRSAHN